jgi:hypothetical protein
MTADEIIAECRRLCARGTKPTLPEVRPLSKAYYALPGNTVGGELHAVLDDGNYERCFIRSCIAAADRPESRWLGHVLLLLSNSQRRRGV